MAQPGGRASHAVTAERRRAGRWGRRRARARRERGPARAWRRRPRRGPPAGARPPRPPRPSRRRAGRAWARPASRRRVPPHPTCPPLRAWCPWWRPGRDRACADDTAGQHDTAASGTSFQPRPARGGAAHQRARLHDAGHDGWVMGGARLRVRRRARRAWGAPPRAGSPLGVFEAEPGTQRGVLSTVLRGGGSLVTPAVAGAAAPAGAVATVVRRDKPGACCHHI
jgi:hypothetical protein